MKMGIIGWGSLIWDARDLNYDKDLGWNKNGPELPIEFARISKDGRLTLVIKEDASVVRTLYALSDFNTLQDAILNLKEREGTTIKNIGYYIKDKDMFYPEDFTFQNNIKDWIKNIDLDAIIWTNLKDNFFEKTGKNPTLNNLRKYLLNLDEKTKFLANKYINKTPEQIKTNLRMKLNINDGM